MTIADEIQALSADRTAIQNAILAKGGTVTSADGFDDFANAIATIPSGEAVAEQKDVNFIDYDGTIVHSYTASEFAALSALPANPSHSGLTAQGWNWSLADAKEYVADCGKLWIGQTYVTDDGKTRIYIHLDEGRLSPILGVCPNGTVDVDWGDNTAHDTLTGTSLLTVKWTSAHNYTASGNYVITLSVNGSMQFAGGNAENTGSYLLRFSSGSDNRNIVYRSAIQKIEIGSNVLLDTNAFAYCGNLKTITLPFNRLNPSIKLSAFAYCYSLISIVLPSSFTTFGNNAFANCYSLNFVSLPKTITSLANYIFDNCYSLTCITLPPDLSSTGTYAFRYCYSLIYATIPSGLTRISNYCFQYCYSLASAVISSNITDIGSYAFSTCRGLGFIRFMSSTPPDVSSNAFTNIPTDCIIYVPSGSLSAYTSAANYPNSSTYTYVEY